MKVVETPLPGMVVLESPVHRDERGHFFEAWHRAGHRDAGLPGEFVQDNVSSSRRGVIRGLHYQHPSPQGKLVTVLRGEILDVGVDIRLGSPTFGRSFGVVLRAGEGVQVYIPEGFAHGFAVTTEDAIVLYKCTRPYDPSSEGSILWSDPDLGIDWPVAMPSLSPKDAQARRLGAIPEERLPRYHAEVSAAAAANRRVTRP
jgi:dTDP-4-dehydrorhamnose 3,5-epimerase